MCANVFQFVLEDLFILCHLFTTLGFLFVYFVLLALYVRLDDYIILATE